ncbi:MAG TPA: carotenoid biosynthesis protein, partial [Anaerolineae bacterium]|nr:carotenoid biosynthesis protein [Anaerolineae bacterium]
MLASDYTALRTSHILFEAIVYALFALCLHDAWRRKAGHPAELLGGLAFGLLLEWINVTFLSGYYYGRFLLMVGPIPLGVGVGWAIIIYASMLTSDWLGLRPWTRPFADALLALNIDLSMDAVAIRLGMWVWGWPPSYDRWASQWFGVPYGNFFGWLMVVLLYSGSVRLFRSLRSRFARWPHRLDWVYPFAAVLPSEVLLYTSLQLHQSGVRHRIGGQLMLGVLLGVT